jgi:hypothetical protein
LAQSLSEFMHASSAPHSIFDDLASSAPHSIFDDRASSAPQPALLSASPGLLKRLTWPSSGASLHLPQRLTPPSSGASLLSASPGPPQAPHSTFLRRLISPSSGASLHPPQAPHSSLLKRLISPSSASSGASLYQSFVNKSSRHLSKFQQCFQVFQTFLFN